MNNRIWIVYAASNWGNQLRESGEGWDDGNILDGDGCNYLWVIETGFTWSGGSSTSKDICNDICGDGKRYVTDSSKCDDGNTANGDGCSSSCIIETGFTWSGGSSTSKDICNDICGDGKRSVTDSSKCDDGNTTNGDGCSSSCIIETGFTWSGGSSLSPDICNDIYGDGKRSVIDSSKCDDGNTANGDGCSSSCIIETGFTWSGGSSTSKDICNDICGDGKRSVTDSSKCDDGNTTNGDGCSSSCIIETGFTWSGGSSLSPDICNDICGDGKRSVIDSSKCDDGNTANGDGCSSSCIIETGFTWSGGSSTSKDICNDICGDGKRYVTDSSKCDDGNTANGDGCSSSCIIETGWSCSGGSSTSIDVWNIVINLGWGDGITSTLYEQWDDGNLISGDGCNLFCLIEKNFNWIVIPNLHDISYWYYVCGDGKIDTGEEWDDGNRGSKDGWDSSWKVELGFKWDIVVVKSLN